MKLWRIAVLLVFITTSCSTATGTTPSQPAQSATQPLPTPVIRDHPSSRSGVCGKCLFRCLGSRRLSEDVQPADTDQQRCHYAGGLQQEI